MMTFTAGNYGKFLFDVYEHSRHDFVSFARFSLKYPFDIFLTQRPINLNNLFAKNLFKLDSQLSCITRAIKI